MISSSQRPLPDNTQQSQQTSIPLVGFEPTNPAGERPQTYALDRAATGTGNPKSVMHNKQCFVEYEMSYSTKHCFIYKYILLLSHPIHTTCSARLMFLDLVTWITGLIPQAMIATVKALCVLMRRYALRNGRSLAD